MTTEPPGPPEPSAFPIVADVTATTAKRKNPRRAATPPRFVEGSILRHILAMTGAGALGLMAIFAGDLANIYFLSRIGDQSVVAAVGYASSILFVSTSIGIGLSIAATALVAPALGAGRRVRARRLSAHAHVLAAIASLILSAMLWLSAPQLLSFLGATGRTLHLAWTYLAILLPTLPMLALGMTSSAVLRSVGDARRAMHVTLFGAVVNVILDVFLIVHLEWGIIGAALASTVARFAIMVIGLYGVIHVHDLMGRPKPATLKTDTLAFSKIAVPAVLTNVATPFGNAYVTYAIAAFGDGAVAGWAIIGRIIPVAFGAIYALSGSVGPVIGQNYGGSRADRMMETLFKSLATMAAFTGFAWIALALFANPLADMFHAEGDARDLILYFCRWLSPLFLFLGAMFIANACFNSLGRPHVSALLNWSRATVGTVPFVIVGAKTYAAEGALAGSMLGGVVFGVIAVILAYRHIARIADDMANLKASG